MPREESSTSLGEGKCVGATDKAVRVELESGDVLWIPASVVHDDSEVYNVGDTGDVVVQTWWAEKNGHA